MPSRHRFFWARRAAPALAFALAVTAFGTGCVSPTPSDPTPTAPAWQPSLNQPIGRIYSVDLSLSYVVIDAAPALTTYPPPGAILLTRTDDLRPTAQLRLRPFRRGRTLGADIIAGQPNPGDEIVWPRLPDPN